MRGGGGCDYLVSHGPTIIELTIHSFPFLSLVLTTSLPSLPRLVRDPRAKYEQSLDVLRHAKRTVPHLITKSSIMLGVGETDTQVLKTLMGEQMWRLEGEGQAG